MRSLFLSAAVLAFVVSVYFAFHSCEYFAQAMSIPRAIISAGFVVGAGLALVAAAVCKDSK
jgi:hypothetical protein